MRARPAHLVTVALLAACGDRPLAPPERPPPTPAAGAMRVMTYNVNFGLAGDPPTIDAIASVRPDVVFLQETNAPWERALVAQLGAAYPHRQFEHPDAWPAGGMGVLSRFPIASIDRLVAPRAPFFAWRVELETPHGAIQVLNVHLRPPMSDGGSWVVGYFSTRADRLREIEHHLEGLDTRRPTLIVGDFNEERTGSALSLLLDERGFGHAVEPFARDTPTWEWPVGSMTLRFQLDHILHDEHFVPVAAAVVQAGRSDHKPVWADLERSTP